MVSNLQGADLFAHQLQPLGIEATVDGPWVEFQFVVPGGKYAGTTILLAIQVPPQFPNAPPSGIDFKPRMPDRPINHAPKHPDRSHESRRFPGAGEYWSRPHQRWNEEPVKDARAYMAWVRNLWITT